RLGGLLGSLGHCGFLPGGSRSPGGRDDGRRAVVVVRASRRRVDRRLVCGRVVVRWPVRGLVVGRVVGGGLLRRPVGGKIVCLVGRRLVELTVRHVVGEVGGGRIGVELVVRPVLEVVDQVLRCVVG